MNYYKKEKEILEETRQFALDYGIFYNDQTEQMIVNAMREIRTHYEGIDPMEKGSLYSEKLTPNG